MLVKISNGVVETTDWIFTSKYPSEPNSIFSKILPLLSTATEIPELADLRKKTDFSTDLKIWAARCCLGPVVFPNQASLVILTIKSCLFFVSLIVSGKITS